MKTLYEKRGRRYYPVAEYSPEVMDSMPDGYHLVRVKPGESFTRYSVDPNTAPVLAAITEHHDALLDAMREAAKGTPDGHGITRLPSFFAVIEALERAILESVK